MRHIKESLERRTIEQISELCPNGCEAALITSVVLTPAQNNLSPDLKKSRLPKLIWSDDWPGVTLRNIRALTIFERQSWRSKSLPGIDFVTSTVRTGSGASLKFSIVDTWMNDWWQKIDFLHQQCLTLLLSPHLHITGKVKSKFIYLKPYKHFIPECDNHHQAIPPGIIETYNIEHNEDENNRFLKLAWYWKLVLEKCHQVGGNSFIRYHSPEGSESQRLGLFVQ